MSSPPFPAGPVVAAALDGDPDAVEALLAGSLHLVYNVVGRAAESDLDVDDIVQETMLRVVRGLSDVRSPDSYRSWLVGIAMRQLADARRSAGIARGARAELPGDAPASDGDLAALLELRASLTQEQRQLTQAVRWLDEPYRDLLAHWWLEVEGQLTRKEVAASFGISQAHLAVRIQRMKRQLDTARSVVRALSRTRQCAGLEAIPGTDRPSPLGRKRIARHLAGCTACVPPRRRLVAPERLLLGIPVLVPPPQLESHARMLTQADPTAWGHHALDRLAEPGSGLPQGDAPAPHNDAGIGHGGTLGRAARGGTAPAKSAAAVGAAVLTAGLLIGVTQLDDGPGRKETPSTGTAPRAGTPAPSLSPSPSPSPSATHRRSSASGPAAVPSPRPSADDTVPRFSGSVPRLPGATIGDPRPLVQHDSVDGRDNGQSARYGDRSVWLFDDTTLRDPFGFVSNSGAATTDLDASDGISLRSATPFSTVPGRPTELIPRTGAETAFERAHDRATGCTSEEDPYCGATFAFWPGPVVADEARDRLLVFYGKLCRGGDEGTPCSGTLGKGLGTGIASLNMRSGEVTRLTAEHGPSVGSVEGTDPTMFFPDGQGYSSAVTVVGGHAYVYGDCDYACRVARVPLTSLTDRAAWRFRTEAGWSADPEAGVRVVAAGSAGQTVFWNEALGTFVNVFMPYGTSDVKFQVGGSPYGPWSEERTAGTVPTQGADPAYALFAHPEYARDGGMTQYLSYYDPKDGDQSTLRLRFSK
ncbi:sigma-70 family RNA polymerase sigma factor [Streptomyces sp. NPDC056405]|uniref:sigma-70 family RNA polymerase sigma factor n=1 Tax=Streptomyces sp. NPDC056405 TaxID=3345811 RepID=UPI0035DE474E